MSDEHAADPPETAAAVDAPQPAAADAPGAADGVEALILDWPDELPAAALPPVLPGELVLPEGADRLVVLCALDADARAELQQLAGELNAAGLATLIADMLTPAEARFANLHHNTPLLTQRLLELLALIRQRCAEGGLPELTVGIYAVGDVAPAAIRAAAQRDCAVAALVCRGGLIDLAGRLYLRTLTAPLLHIVGRNPAALAATGRAFELIDASKALHPLADGDALPLGSATLAATCALTLDWFARHLHAPGAVPSGAGCAR